MFFLKTVLKFTQFLFFTAVSQKSRPRTINFFLNNTKIDRLLKGRESLKRQNHLTHLGMRIPTENIFSPRN